MVVRVTDADDDAKNLGGRPTDYKPEFAEQAAKLCLLGATDNELADFFKVHRATIYRWKHDHPEFCGAIVAGKESADERVERALYHKAIGYTFESEKVFQYEGQIIRAPIVEHVPPSDTAAIFWLKNRRSGTWRDKQEHGITDKEGNDVPLGDLEAARRVAFLLSNAARKAE